MAKNPAPKPTAAAKKQKGLNDKHPTGRGRDPLAASPAPKPSAVPMPSGGGSMVGPAATPPGRPSQGLMIPGPAADHGASMFGPQAGPSAKPLPFNHGVPRISLSRYGNMKGIKPPNAMTK